MSKEKMKLYLEAIQKNLGIETRMKVEKLHAKGLVGEGLLLQLSGVGTTIPTLPPDVRRREGKRK